MRAILSVLLALVLVVSLIVVVSPATPVAADPAGNYVNGATGSDATGDGSSGNPWQTIQYAVNNSGNGTTINVAAGNYTENVLIRNKTLTIQGAGMATTNVTASNIDYACFRVFSRCRNTTIKGFTLQGSTNSSGVDSTNATSTRITSCRITGNINGVSVGGTSSNTTVTENEILGNTAYGIKNDTSGSEQVQAQKNWWGDISGPDGPRLDSNGNPTGLLPGLGDNVTERVWCLPWLTRPYATVERDVIAYFATTVYANAGWNIISTALALDGNVWETNTGANYTANTWGGLKNLGYKEAGDDYALKLYYEVQGGVKVYSDIYYWDSSDNGTWKTVGNGTQMNPIDGYYVRMMAPDSIPLLWSPNLSAPSKYLYAGWNLVGYSYMPLGGPGTEGISSSLETALKTIETVPSAAGDVKGYAQVVSPSANQYPFIYIPPSAGETEGTYIEPQLQAGQQAKTQCKLVVGRGYWVFMVNPGRLAGLTFTPSTFRIGQQ